MAIARKYSEAEINQIFESAQALTDKKEFEKAEQAFALVLKTFPNHPHVLSSYAKLNTLTKNYSKAKKLINSAIKLAPNDIFVLLDLAIYYSAIEDYKGYMRTLEKAIAIEPLNIYATINLFDYHLTKCNYEALKNLLVQTQKSHPRSLNDVMLKIMCAVIANIENNIEACEELLVATEYFGSEESVALEDKFPHRRTLRVYQLYTKKLLEWRKENPEYYSTDSLDELHIIGDSHSYGAANATSNRHILKTKLVINTSIWALLGGGEKVKKQVLKEHLKSIEKGSKVLLSFGEIDCRANKGIHKNHRKAPQQSIAESIENLVVNYVEHIAKHQKNCAHDFYLINCPAPLEKFVRSELDDEQEIEKYKTIPTQFNTILAEQAAKHGMKIIDIYRATHAENGWSKENIHLDSVHLKPNVIVDLLNSQPLS